MQLSTKLGGYVYEILSTLEISCLLERTIKGTVYVFGGEHQALVLALLSTLKGIGINSVGLSLV